jgi:hypothetical protein
VAETGCKTPRLRPRAVIEHGSKVREAKLVGVLTNVGVYLWKGIRGKGGKGYERRQAITGPGNMFVV